MRKLRETDNGHYLMDVTFLNGEKAVMALDSGAQVSVCPYGWGEQYGMHDPSQWISMRAANGSNMPHYGERRVVVTSSAF